MKKNLVSCLFSMVALVSPLFVHAGDIYKQELATLKVKSETKYIFNKKTEPCFADLHKNIQNCKELSIVQRLVRYPFLTDGVVVTAETMPVLYGYVDALCKEHNVATPVVFISSRKSIFNAFAAKLFASTGGIFICQKLILETSDRELEAVIAHEIGHIKHDHVNKHLLLHVSTWIASCLMADYALKKTDSGSVFLAQFLTVMYLPSLLINKRFEKQADEFACKEVGNASGLIEFFEHLEAKEVNAEQEHQEACQYTHKVLAENKAKLNIVDRISFNTGLYLIKINHSLTRNLTNFYKWIYHNTFIGAHPSPQARIAAAKKYLSAEVV